jgi:hypothetical protein
MESDLDLHTSQGGGTKAVVHTLAEGQMGLVLAADVELIR